MTEFCLECLECGHSVIRERSYLLGLVGDIKDPKISNLNSVMMRFKCSKCLGRLVRLKSGLTVYFDSSRIISCVSCKLPIPIPRIELVSNASTCADCAEEANESIAKGTLFPNVPIGMRGKCPTCEKKAAKGIVVVYQNAKDKEFFLGCSGFPRCRWSTNSFYEELNM